MSHDHHHHHNDVDGRPPVLDIGGDIGAMVATMDREAAGSELHLRSEHEPPISIHTGVWDRHHGSGLVTAAVFAELVAGTYWVLDGNGAAVHRVEIEGGAVATIDLRR
jgi:hypothetical protein